VGIAAEPWVGGGAWPSGAAVARPLSPFERLHACGAVRLTGPGASPLRRRPGLEVAHPLLVVHFAGTQACCSRTARAVLRRSSRTAARIWMCYKCWSLSRTPTPHAHPVYGLPGLTYHPGSASTSKTRPSSARAARFPSKHPLHPPLPWQQPPSQLKPPANGSLSLRLRSRLLNACERRFARL